jgi:hypothetical protein
VLRPLNFPTNRTNTRAERFLVEEDSELFYDPSPLLESQKKQIEPETVDDRHFPQQTQDFIPNHSPQNHRGAAQNYQYGNSSPAGSYPMTRHASHQGNVYPTSSFNAIPPNQFYGGGDVSSPVRMSSMSMDSMNISPDIRRRVTRGMTEDGYGMHGS